MSEFLNFKRYKTKPVKVKNCNAAVVPDNAGISIQFHGQPVEPGQVVVEYEDGKTEILTKEDFVDKWIPFRKSTKKPATT